MADRDPFASGGGRDPFASQGGRDPFAEPQPQKEPTYDTPGMAAQRGFVRSVLGAPGEAEKFFGVDVPEFFGQGKQQMPKELGGRETFFPTTKDLEKTWLLGDPKDSKYKDYGTAGELIPLAAGGAGLVKKGIEKIGPAISGLRPAKLAETLFGEAGTVSDVGKKISDTLMTKFKDLVGSRKQEAKTAFDKYFSDARPVEQKITNDYAQTLERYKQMFSKDISQDEVKLINDSLNRLKGGEVGIGRLEKERRKLNDIASGFDVEGYSSIQQAQAKRLTNLLRTNIEKDVPSAANAFKVYEEASAPINQFARATGSKVTTRAGEYLPDVPKVDVANLPSSFFKSEQSIKDLKNLSGDPNFATQAAREHVASELYEKGFKKVEQVDSYIRTNRDWLKEVPDVLKDLEKYKSNLSTGETIKSGIKATPYIGAGLYGIDKFKGLFGQ